MDETFATGSSLLHRTDPRVKLLVAASFVGVVALSDSFRTVMVALAFSVLFLLIARLAPIKVGKRLLAANGFTLFLLLTLPLTYGGSGSMDLGPVSLSTDGLHLAALITLKTNVIVLTVIALLGTSRIAQLGHGLEGLHLPRRLCFLLLFSYRYIFVIHQEYQRLSRAAALRCFTPATNIHTYRTYGYLFGMTLIRSWNRSFRVHQAMQLRGFDGRLIPLDQQQLGPKDIAFFGAGLMIVLILMTLPLW